MSLPSQTDIAYLNYIGFYHGPAIRTIAKFSGLPVAHVEFRMADRIYYRLPDILENILARRSVY